MIDEPDNNEDEIETGDDETTDSHVSQMINAAIDANPEAFRDSFIDAMNFRIASGIEAVTPEIAAGMFAEPEESESTDED